MVYRLVVNESAFAFDIRVLSCNSCGAPVRGALGGGECVCEYCGTRMVIAPRADAPVPASKPSAESEAARKRALQEQAASTEPSRYSTERVPNGAEGLADYNSAEPRAGIDELERRWREALSRASQGGDPDAAREAFWYTEILNKRLSLVDEHLRRRAVLETGLDALDDPGYRHVIFTDLASAAVRLGDVDSAESWVLQADPSSDDLFLDSTYRIALARVRQAQGDAPEVLELVGEPIHRTCEMLATVYRIDGLERTGQGDAAWSAFLAAVKHPKWGKAVPLFLRKGELAPGVLARLASAGRGMRGVMIAASVGVGALVAWAIFG
jgi:DNA-directed RNA polymerase subunit RPC12/RpoP